MTPGAQAGDRLPGPLAARSLLIRPQSVAESFCMAGRLLGAETLNSARKDPTVSAWARLFQNEPAYLLAELLSFDPANEGFTFAQALERDPAEAQRLVHNLAQRLETWIRRIRRDAPAPFARQIDQMNVETKLEQRIAMMSPLAPSEVPRALALRPQPQAVDQNQNPLAFARALREELRATHTLLRNAVATLQPQAQQEFDARLTSGHMDPGLGLLIAELRMGTHVEAAINRLPERHTQLYYGDILGQHPAPASAERVFLDLGSGPQHVFLPQGTELEARLPDDSVQHFSTEASVHVSPARVSDIAVLSYETDRDISYNAAFGGITNVRAARMEPGPLSRPERVFSVGRDLPLVMGLDISSPMLSLAEGTRIVEVALNLNRSSNLPATSRDLTAEERATPRPKPDPEVRLALASDPDLVLAFRTDKLAAAIEELAREITDRAEQRGQTPSLSMIHEYLVEKVTGVENLRVLLGRIVTMCLIEQVAFPAGVYWTRLFTLIDKYRPELTGQSTAAKDRYPGATQDSMIFSAFSQNPDGTIDYPPEDVFQQLLGDAFDITVTTAQGPISPSVMQVLPVRKKVSAGGMVLSMRFGDEMPAIAGATPEQAPTLSLRYAAAARISPISFFERYVLENINFTVKVTGMRKLAAFSDDSPLTTDQTFLPFGIRPMDGATFQVGCAEMARKPVTDVSVALTWDDMPNLLGGFASHYAGYAKGIEIPAPELTLDYLSGDGWKAVSTEPVPLFDTEPITGALEPNWTYKGAVSGHSIPATGRVTTAEYQSRQTVRAGMIRMRISGTAGGFHADQYPRALVDAMRPRLLLIGARQIPPAPFVPTIASFTLGYTARATMEINAPDSASTGERIVQVGPFGAVEVFPKRMLRATGIFPPRLGYGQLFVQITGADATGPTALAFEMANSGHLRLLPDQPNPIRWYYLSATGWRELPETMLSSDTTAGLMRSGLVMIDLPDDATDHSPEMPAGGVWVAAVATRPDLALFPALGQIKVNGVWALRTDNSYHASQDPRVWTFSLPQPGIGAITEITTPAAIRPPEAPDAYIARVGERLRHRRRAVTPWDIERMVLEEFPEVWMAKCLSHLDRMTTDPSPGTATLVAVRRPPKAQALLNPAPSLFEVAVLQRIRAFLDGLSSDFARIEVVNPAYERLQVRAKIEVEPERENGAMAQLLKLELARYLSVWTADAGLGRFGWSLNVRMLHAHIADQPYVGRLTDFSVLHLTSDDNRSYRLFDTAQTAETRGNTYGPILGPRQPWALPISAPDHILTILQDLKDEQPQASGIGALSVGDMLIVGQRTTP